MDQFPKIVKQVLDMIKKSSRGAGNTAAAGIPIVLAVAALGGAGMAASQSIVTIRPGQIGIVYNRIGGLSETRKCMEGMNFIIPWFQRTIVYDVKTRPQLINTQSGSKDLQMIQISLRVLFRPNPQRLTFIYRRLGTDYEERVLPSIVNEVTKAVVAKYNASELLTKREIVSREIIDILSKRAGDFEILLDDVSITHIAFSKEYTAAVEAKQVAQQESERAKYIVDKAIQEKKQIVIRAEGEAQSAQLIGNAIKNNPAFLQLRQIEASKDVANIISGSANKVYLNSGNLLINTLSHKAKEEKKTGYLW